MLLWFGYCFCCSISDFVVFGVVGFMIVLVAGLWCGFICLTLWLRLVVVDCVLLLFAVVCAGLVCILVTCLIVLL